jgi:hypothetical protein
LKVIFTPFHLPSPSFALPFPLPHPAEKVPHLPFTQDLPGQKKRPLRQQAVGRAPRGVTRAPCYEAKAVVDIMLGAAALTSGSRTMKTYREVRGDGFMVLSRIAFSGNKIVNLSENRGSSVTNLLSLVEL